MPCSLSKYVIILACGNGSRMQSDVPKQYLLLENLPIVMHTIKNVHSFDKDYKIILVINQEHRNLWNDLEKKYSFNIPLNVVYGGPQRFYSVKNALKKVKSPSLVAVHDGVRPFASKQLFDDCFLMAKEKGNAVCCVPSTDSVRVLNGRKSSAIARDKVYMVQTPQVFQSDIILKAYKQRFSKHYTDDASVVEHLGYNINIVKGSQTNIKITYPIDLAIAHEILKQVR